MEAKKSLLTYAGLKKLEDELHDLKVNRRKEVAGKIKEAREQGDLSENAEYDAAKDEQRDIETRIEEIEKILKNVEVVVEAVSYTHLASSVTLVMGLAIANACREFCNVDARIKWPNDIVVNGKKICGILTEMSSEVDYINYLVIGRCV